jgi:uncharacterized protein YbjT (DUF2867 family)
VARVVAAVATRPPAQGVVEIAGPEELGLEDAVARVLAATNDRRRVLADPDARYFGAMDGGGFSCRTLTLASGRYGWPNWLSTRGGRAVAAT